MFLLWRNLEGLPNVCMQVQVRVCACVSFKQQNGPLFQNIIDPWNITSIPNEDHKTDSMVLNYASKTKMRDK